MKKKKSILIFIFVFLALTVYILLKYFCIIPSKTYTLRELGYSIVKSQRDKDKDGIDDYTDIMLGSREYVMAKPKYKSGYYKDGYPPKGEGVCTDVIWYAFKKAGYNLKYMVDEDIRNNVKEYYRIEAYPDSNIDFRRVPNLLVFFRRNALSLTTDIKKVDKWQAGDIITFGDSHIGIISDKRSKNGEIYRNYSQVQI